MDIIRFAMQMEIDGQKFYEQAAAESQQKELREIFMYLAEEEKRHFLFFKSLDDGQPDKAAGQLSGGSMAKTKNIFLKMLESGENKNFGNQAKQAWKKALEIEEQAVKLYTEEIKRQSDPTRRELLTKIADEERNHVYLVSNILSYMQDPETFAESQRFAAFKSWEGH